MSVEFDQQEAARVASADYQELRERAVPLTPRAHYVAYYEIEPSHEEPDWAWPFEFPLAHESYPMPRGTFGTLAAPWEDVAALLGEVLSRPDEFAYAAIFDVAGPAWMIPVAEWTGRRDINEITSTRNASGRGRALVGWQMGEWSRGGWPAWPYGYYLY